ncbi:hypothetical protein HanRHA438_Chr12g0558161 [Helianthus annuus]|nr:hypothetical protein HanRHA438_Chr12g0558161 [Helianthus annuus]
MHGSELPGQGSIELWVESQNGQLFYEPAHMGFGSGMLLTNLNSITVLKS